jgi:hypothetical protein
VCLKVPGICAPLLIVIFVLLLILSAIGGTRSHKQIKITMKIKKKNERLPGNFGRNPAPVSSSRCRQLQPVERVFHINQRPSNVSNGSTAEISGSPAAMSLA